jgi:regulator of sigma E protease
MSDFLTNTIAFIFALGVIIFIHELGHLLIAKLFDTRVKTFSLGFGKRLFGFQRGETDYRVSLIPLGGYVALGGEQPEDATGDPREFLSKPRWQRVLVYLAGPAMNVVLSIGLIAGAFMIGVQLPNLAAIEPVVGEVEAGSSAAAAGIETGDRIVAVEGEPVDSWESVIFALLTSPAKPVHLELERGGETFAAEVVPGKVPGYEVGDSAGLVPEFLPEVIALIPGKPAEAAGFLPGDKLKSTDGRPVGSVSDFIQIVEAHPGQEIRVEVERAGRRLVVPVVPEEQGGVGKIGASIGISNIFQQYGPARAFAESWRENLSIVRQTFALLGKIVTGQLSARGNLGGPIEIAAQSGAAARRGFSYLLYFMGFISISIALLNLMPIPLLDGGQILILLVESVIRRDLPLRVKEAIAQVGFVLILLLMAVVIYFDLARRMGG